MSARPQDAERFLKFAFPGGPWKLTAILDGKTKKLETRTFPEGSEPAMLHWAEEKNNDGWNIYFQIARWDRAKDRAQKISRDDVLGVSAMWIDIDCGPGSVKAASEPFGRPEWRAKKKLPTPSLLIFSGNGVWPFWLLEDELTDVEDVAARNAALADRVRDLPKDDNAEGVDSAQNADRIARLPGFINWPDAGKEAKGCKPVLATWMAYTTEPTRYPSDKFQSFVGARGKGETSPLAKTATGAAPISSVVSVAKLSDLGLDPDNGDWLAAMIVTGHPKEVVETGWPTEPPPKGGRSETVHAVACELARRGVDPEKIAGTFLNPDWAISAHVGEQKDPTRYAIRQAERGLEKVAEAEAEKVLSLTPPTDPRSALDWMNHRHFVLEVDGKECVVASRMPSDLAPERSEIKVQSFTALRQRYYNRRVEVRDGDGNVKLVPLGDFWLGSAGRRQFLRVMFRPGDEPVVEGCYNLWQGFGFEPKAGDWSRMRAHITEVLADGDPGVAEYILCWSAYAVQNLAGPQGVILAFRGGKGSGKGTFARALTELFGQHGLHITSSDLLTGRFTGHLEDCCLLFADEAIHPGDREAEARLKGLVTEPVLTLEAKGRDARPARNHLKIVMASNEEWIAPASWDERRYAVFDVSPKRIGDKRYFADLNAELENGGREAMLADLLAMDLGDWRPGDTIPDTTALRSQKDLSLPPEEAWLLAILESGEIPGERPEHFAPYCRPSKWRLSREGGLLDDMRRSGRGLADRSDQALGRFLGRWIDRYTTGSARGWRFPPLSEMRARWEAKHGPREWPEGVEEWPVEAFAEEVARDLPF